MPSIAARVRRSSPAHIYERSQAIFISLSLPFLTRSLAQPTDDLRRCLSVSQRSGSVLVTPAAAPTEPEAGRRLTRRSALFAQIAYAAIARAGVVRVFASTVFARFNADRRLGSQYALNLPRRT